ncbi:heme exporter protein CcmD [Stenotrophomonas sp. SY1]|uniref:heme exporter protein CcmD n=1 Tax=Stenotrophomonas sp. SY1 TaxID=477235 RepID=UPI001E489C67|nr:heme exporter protein CcmD [Stenotrophomonas sp. SY1]MCD9086771.1 heme exporter protein CcmD [Stenotrophomonas sp. SY1]
MSYFKYVALAYAVFFIVLAWDFIVPRLQLRQQLREARNRIARVNRSVAAHDDGELSR